MNYLQGLKDRMEPSMLERALRGSIDFVKTTIELASLVAAMNFIARAFETPVAKILSSLLLILLGAHISIAIQKLTTVFVTPKREFKRFLIFCICLLLGVAISIAIQMKVILPILHAIERQLDTTLPPKAPQGSHEPSGTPTPAKPKIDAPKQHANPPKPIEGSPAPSAQPSDAQSRNSSHVERKP